MPAHDSHVAGLGHDPLALQRAAAVDHGRDAIIELTQLDTLLLR